MPIVVLVSGSGSNLQAIIGDAGHETAPFVIRGVISNRPDAFGLQRAQQAGIPTTVVNHTDYPDRESFDAALQAAIDAYQPGLVVLAGFMRILTEAFVLHYEGRMLNIHPSLLPKFQGLHTHQRALDAGETEHGATVHFVTYELDGGPAVMQARVPVLTTDSESELAERVLSFEHKIYPQVIRWYAEGRLTMTNGQAVLDNQPLSAPLQFRTSNA